MKDLTGQATLPHSSRPRSPERVRILAAGALLTNAACGGAVNLADETIPMPGRTATVALDCSDEPFSADVALIADTQLHNLFGSGLFTSGGLSDTIKRTAARPPALDIWSALLLRKQVSSLTSPTEGAAPLVLVLGDAANVSCTGEFDRFVETIDAARGSAAWLMAPGNHDAFMMGNTNSYGAGTLERGENGLFTTHDPQRSAAMYILESDAAKTIPSADSEYTAAESRLFAYDSSVTTCEVAPRSWAAACADPRRDSAPMNKGSWLWRYLKVLEKQGLRVRQVGDGAPSDPDAARAALDPRAYAPGRWFDGAATGEPLASLHVRASGKIYSRRRVDKDVDCPTGRNGCKIDSREFNPWRSFIVQSVDVGEVVGILVDTDNRADDVRSNAVQMLGGNWAGSKATIEPEQLSVIAQHVAYARKRGRSVVFFAHHPLTDLDAGIQRELLQLAPEAYVSAHTHFASSLSKHATSGGGELFELNVGSTTDAPIETALLSLRSGSARWKVMSVAGVDTGCGVFSPSWRPRCAPPSRDRNHLAYRGGPLSRGRHGLCLLADELRQMRVAHVGWPSIGADALTEHRNWWRTAQDLSATVDAMYEVARPGSLEERLALCDAVNAAQQELQDPALADEYPEWGPRFVPASSASRARW